MNEDRRVLIGRMMRYGLAGLLAAGIYNGAAILLVELAHVAPTTAVLIAQVIVTITSYVVNRAYVFDTDRSHSSSFPRFAIATLLSLGLSYGLMYLTTEIMGWPYIAGLILATVILPPVNFVVNYLWAFRRDTPVA